MIDSGYILQALIVGGLLSTAGLLLRTVVKLAELAVEVGEHSRRLDRLEQP